MIVYFSLFFVVDRFMHLLSSRFSQYQHQHCLRTGRHIALHAHASWVGFCGGRVEGEACTLLIIKSSQEEEKKTPRR